MRGSIKIKDSIHDLIDKINDNELLEILYQLLNNKEKEQEGKLLNELTNDQKKDLYNAYNESLNDSNLIDLESIKEKHLKWRER